MGLEYQMLEQKGPWFEKTIRSEEGLKYAETDFDVEDRLGYVLEAIRVTNKELNGRVPLIGFAGVMVVVLPNLQGSGGWYNLVMLAASPVFAASFLITKALTRYEKPGVIVLWQSITVSIFSIPMALMNWQNPTLLQWVAFFAAGVLGTAGHYSLTRAFHTADISATQSLRFLDLIWASLMGWWVFSDVPSHSTWLGALVILLSTVWIARREGRRPVLSD